MKKIKYVVISVVVIALGLWVWSRWDVWFHNPEEPPYTPQPYPHRVLLTFGDSDGRASRNVSWQCDSVLHASWLELVALPDSDTVRIQAKGEVFRSRSGQAAFYVARLRGLKGDAAYSYRAVTNGKSSPWYSFTTPSDNSRLSFLYVGDVQDTIDGKANCFLREAFEHHPQSEFLVCGGDLTERPMDKFWAETFRGLDGIGQTKPVLVVTGNHDYLKGVIMTLERRFSLILSYFLDSKVGDNQVYTLSYGPAQFFLLDSNREFPYLFTQRKWLRQQLQQSRAKWKIVILHHPLISIKHKNNNLFQRWAFKDLIEEYGVDLVLQGHEHAYGRFATRQPDNRPTTPVYTISHCSPKSYSVHSADRFDIVSREGRYYQSVSINADTLVMAAYDVYTHSAIDSIRIIKIRGRR
ncbi:MAG: metallophosphoesterase family protein [Bacteroidaceae bacterium]|nr:metallophosphoesterase family protein [Bacteroidaceae bacterium]